MRVTKFRDQSGAAGRRYRFAQRRKRGTTLIELVLYISIATVIMTFSIGLLREEQVRRERTALAAELQQVTTAAQTFVSANYETIRDELLRDTPPGSDLIRAYGMDDVVAQGYLPAIFAQTGTTPKSFVDSLQYGLVVRAVRRSQSNYAGGAFPPTQTRTVDLIDPDTDPADPVEFENTLVDNKYNDTVVNPVTGAVQDDEIDLEALLVTISSDPCRIVPAAQGPRIISQSETNAAGYVTGLGIGTTVPTTCSAEVQNNLAWTGIETGATALMAIGPYGGWRLPLEPYSGLVLTAAEFPSTAGQVFDGQRAVQAGRFVSLLALPERPPLSESAKIAQEGDSALRCAGLPTNSVKELECMQSDVMFASLTFEEPWDSDNDGTDDTFPGLYSVNTIQMAAPPADGTAQITNILSLSCATGNTVPTDIDRFTVDCPNTQMQGLVVTSDAAFDTNVKVASQLVVGETPPTGPSGASADLPTTGKIILDGETGDITLYGESLAEKFTGRLSHTFSGESFLAVDQPDCPTGFDPDISVMPIAFKTNEDFRAVETQVSTSGSIWKVKLLVKSELSGVSSATMTQTNPPGSEVVVLTGCKSP